jgi:biopolymer transport protein ExbD
MTVRKRATGDGKLNLMPVMNLVTILIPMLLATAELAEVASIETTAPGIADEGEVLPPGEAPLVLRVSSVGVAVDGVPEGVTIETELRCAGDVCARAADYPLEQLTEALAQVKGAHPSDDRVIIEPAGNVPYGVLVAVMDAARTDGAGEMMFPRVVVGGGL